MRRVIVSLVFALAMMVPVPSASAGPICDAAAHQAQEPLCQQTGAGCLVATGAGQVFLPGPCP